MATALTTVVVELLLPIASVAGRLDPPQRVRVTNRVGRWLIERGLARAVTSKEAARAINLTKDTQLASENARPGDTYPWQGQLLRRPERTEFFGDVQTGFHYARRGIEHYSGLTAQYQEMRAILNPAIMAMEARKPPLMRLTERDVKIIEHAIDELSACYVRLHQYMMEKKHLAPRKQGGLVRAEQAAAETGDRNEEIFAAFNRDQDQRSFAGRKAPFYELTPRQLRKIIQVEKKRNSAS